MTGTFHIVVAMKPVDGSFVQNALKHGVAGLNIDECRVATNPAVDDKRLGGQGTWSSDKMAKSVYEGGYAGVRVGSNESGRFPANLILGSSEELVGLFPVTGSNWRVSKANGKTSIWGSGNASKTDSPDDTGSAARFFKQAGEFKI